MTSAGTGANPLALDALPSMPAAAVRIVSLCDDPDVSMAQLGEAVALDPALAARILRIANSAAFSRGNRVTSINQAMMLMGIKLVKLTALGFVISSTLSEGLGHGGDVAAQVWRQCLVKAVAARELASAARLRYVQEAFLAGLFDGMGQLLGLLTRPEQYGALLAQHPFPRPKAEVACLGTDTSSLAQAALGSWGVPDLYPRILGEADSHPDRYDHSEVGRLAAVLVLARQSTHLLLGYPNLDEGAGLARRSLGIAPDVVDRVAVGLGDNVNAWARSMDLDLGAEVDFEELLAHSRRQMVETSVQIAAEALRQESRITSLEDQRDAMQRDTYTDRLTGLPNRARFDDALAAVIADRIAGRTLTGGLGIAMIDIDHFKRVNDTYGHGVGDRVLATVGQALAANTRDGELIARYGGEEFVLILPIVDTPQMLEAAAERIREMVAGLQIDAEGLQLNVTVSVGAVAAATVLSERAGASLTEAADRLLYQAKHAGRNTCRSDFLGWTD